MTKMIKISVFAVCAFGALMGSAAADDLKVEVKPAQYGAFNYLGVIEANGDTTKSYGTSGEPISNQPFSHFGGWVGFGATIEDRTDVSVVLAMMTWNSLPLTPGSPFTRMQSLGSNLGHAYLAHRFGEAEMPWLTLKLGAFPYQYSSGRNLGGRLFTSGTYPGTLTSNFWNPIDGNDYGAQGLLGAFAFLDGSLKLDATLFFEHGLEPHYDLSPGVVASYKIGEWAEIGAGAVFSHLIAWDDDAVTPKKRNNAYLGGQRLASSEWLKPGLEFTDTLIVDSTDARHGQEVLDRPDVPGAKYLTRAENGIPNSQLEYYTFKGTKAMGRLTITPFSLGGTRKASLYAEATLLGIKDYPFFYEKKAERLPVMFGMDLPMPGGFEVGAEVEHYKNKFMNNLKNVYEEVLPQWQEKPWDFYELARTPSGAPIQDGTGGFVTTATPRASHENGEWFWSLTASKTAFGRAKFSAKMAHDFLRLYNFFGNPSDNPAFQHQDGYYITIKSEIAI
jgi:hypothetical protein